MITLKDFSAGYYGRRTVSIEDLSFPDGSITCILGENGSGIIPYLGSARADGKEISSMSSRARAQVIGFMPQNLMASDMLVCTLMEHGRFSRLGLSKVLGQKDREAVERALSLTGMEELAERKVRTLSGGERQRAYLAMVMAQDPQTLLLDEPMASMDIGHQLLILDILKALKKDGHSLVITSHDLPQAFTIADQICLIREGSLLAAAAPQTLLQEPDLLRSCMGAGLVPLDVPGAVYPYTIIK